MTHVIRLINIDGKPVLPEHKLDAATIARFATENRATPGPYLEFGDVEAFDGRGDARFTRDPGKALCFPTFDAAAEFWQRQSRTRPTRDDGEPNRPLTTFSVTIEALP